MDGIFIKAKEKVQKDLILTVSKEEKFVTQCTAGNLSYVGMEDGTLKPCEILNSKIGNFTKEKSMQNLFMSNEAKELRLDSNKAQNKLNWKNIYNIDSIIDNIYEWDISKNTDEICLITKNQINKYLEQVTN